MKTFRGKSSEQFSDSREIYRSLMCEWGGKKVYCRVYHSRSRDQNKLSQSEFQSDT